MNMNDDEREKQEDDLLDQIDQIDQIGLGTGKLLRSVLSDLTKQIEQEISQIHHEQLNAPASKSSYLGGKATGLKRAKFIIAEYEKEIIDLMYPNPNPNPNPKQ